MYLFSTVEPCYWQGLAKIMAEISNHIQCVLQKTQSCRIFNGILAKLWHEQVFTFHYSVWPWLFVHVLILMLPNKLALTKRHCLFYLRSKYGVSAQNLLLCWCWARSVLSMCLAEVYLCIIWVHIGFVCVYFECALYRAHGELKLWFEISTSWTQKKSWKHASANFLCGLPNRCC